MHHFGVHSMIRWCSWHIKCRQLHANKSVDIDVVDDCQQHARVNYLLSVTALNASNQRTFSAYGLTHVDFGAPVRISIPLRKQSIWYYSGTSFASPIAAGLVGYCICSLCKFRQSSPMRILHAAAIFIRDVIFMGVKPIPGLESTIRFGGSLNAGNSMS
jgi:hypothetical protein